MIMNAPLPNSFFRHPDALPGMQQVANVMLEHGCVSANKVRSAQGLRANLCFKRLCTSSLALYSTH